MEEKAITTEETVGVGIGLPGPIEENGEIACAVNLHWGRKNVEKELEELTGMPVKAGNDANVAALGEMWKGGGKGAKNLILATLGTGVGGGIIINEKIVTGAHGAGGEIGHAMINPAEEKACNCGNKGCLEQYASATGIASLARKALEKTEKESLLRSKSHVTAKDVFDAYKENDALAQEIVDEFAEYLGRALAVLPVWQTRMLSFWAAACLKQDRCWWTVWRNIIRNMHFLHARQRLLNWQLWEMMRESAEQLN